MSSTKNTITSLTQTVTSEGGNKATLAPVTNQKKQSSKQSKRNCYKQKKRLVDSGDANTTDSGAKNTKNSESVKVSFRLNNACMRN